jgi:hypothetical protein
MYQRVSKVIAQVALITALAAFAVSAQAQSSDKQDKEPIYIYVASWAIPRAKWAEYEKPAPANQKVMDSALNDGTLVSYGQEADLIHSVDGFTHDSWWGSHSVAGVMKVLDSLEKLPTTTNGVINTATKHADSLLVSRHYNWHSGSYKEAYEHGSSYKLKATAPDDAVEILSSNVFVPLFEKLLADGSVVEYDIDEESIHTEAPDSFWVYYMTPTADGLDKVNAAIRDAVKQNALVGPAFDSMVDFTPHRDSLTRTDATFK